MADPTGVRFVRNIVTSWVSRILIMAATFVATPVIVHGLGPREYGLWAVAFTLTSYLSLIDVGINGGLIRVMSLAHARGDRDTISGYLTTGLVFYAALGAVLLAVIFGVRDYLAHAFQVSPGMVSTAGWLFVGITLILVVNNLTDVFVQTLNAYEAIHVSAFLTLLVQILNSISLITAVLVFHAGVDGLIIASSVVAVLGLLVTAATVLRRYPYLRLKPRFVRWAHVREITGLSLVIQISNIAGTVNISIDKLVIAAVLGLSSAGVWDLGSRLAVIIWVLCWMVGSAAYPVASRLSEENSALIQDFYLRAERYLFVTACGLSAGLVLVAPWLIPFWLGQGYNQVVLITQILALAAVGPAIAQVSKVTLWGLKRLKEVTIFEFWRLTMHVLLSIFLTWRFGLHGAMAAVLCSLTLPSLWLVWITHRRLGVPLGRWLSSAAARPLAAAIVTATLTWLVMRVTVVRVLDPSTRLNALLLLLTGGLLYSALYLTALAKLRVFTADDLGTFRRGPEAMWGRVRGMLGAARY